MPLFTEPMRKFELVVMKNDVDAVMRYLGFVGCVQLATDGQTHELSEEEKDLADLKTRLVAVARFLGVDAAPVVSRDTPTRESLRVRALALVESTKALLDEETGFVQRRLALRQAAEELGEFASVTVSFSDLESLSWLTYRVGTVDADHVETLTARLQKRAMVFSLKTPGHVLLVAPKKGRWALDTELKKFDFQEGHLPADAKGRPSDMIAAAERNLQEVEAALATVEKRKLSERERIGAELRSLLFHLDLDTTIDTVKQGFAATGSVQKVGGWVPARRFAEISRGLDELTRGSLALSACEPEEVPEVKAKKAKVPVSTPHGKLTSAFERMVLSYSVPAYGTIDPTPFVAAIFVVLFGIMFGDVGQGLVGLIIGLLINSGRVKPFETYRRKHFGTTFILAGAAAMISGFLYGSVFANETVLEPFTRLWTGAIFGHPLDKVIALGGFQKILMFFGVTIGIGAVINSAGIIINIVNFVRRRDWEQAFLTKTGLAGALFFWYFLFVGGAHPSRRLHRGSGFRGARCAAPRAGAPRAARADGEAREARPEGRRVRLHHGGDRRGPRDGHLLHLQLRFVPPCRRIRAGPHGPELDHLHARRDGGRGLARNRLADPRRPRRQLDHHRSRGPDCHHPGGQASVLRVLLQVLQRLRRGVLAIYSWGFGRFEVKKRIVLSLVLFLVAATPVLFAQSASPADAGPLAVIKYISAALAVGFATIGGGIAVGQIGAAAMAAMSENPELSGRALPFVGLAEGICLWGFIVALMIISA